MEPWEGGKALCHPRQREQGSIVAGSNPLVPRVPRGHAEGPRRALHRREWLRSRAWKSRPGQNRGGQPVLCPRGRYYLVLQGAGCQHNPADCHCRRRPVQACPWAGTCLRLTTSKPPAPQQCVLQEARGPLLLEPAQGPRAWGPGGGEAGAARPVPSHLQDPSCCAGCLPDRVPKPSGDRASREARRRGCSGKRSFGGAKVTHAALRLRHRLRGPCPSGGKTPATPAARRDHRTHRPRDFRGPKPSFGDSPGELRSPHTATGRRPITAKGHEAKRQRRSRLQSPRASGPRSGECAPGGPPGLQVAQSRAVTARGAVGASLAGCQACGGVPCPPGDRRRPPGCGASGMQVAPVPCPLRAPHGPPGVGWGAAVRSCPLSPAGLQGVAQTALLYSPGGCAACTLRSRCGDPSKPSRGAAKSRPARGPLPGQRPWAPWRAAPHSSRIPSSPA